MESTDVLIALVGDNPVSVLVAVRGLLPRRLVLLATHKTEAKAKVVGGLAKIPCAVLVWPDVPAIDALGAELVQDAALQSSDRVVLDITGATKQMTIGAWLALERRGVGFGAVALQNTGSWVDARSGKALPQPELGADDHLALHQMRCVASTWRGAPHELPADLLRRIAEAMDLFRRLIAGRLRPFAGKDDGFRSQNIWLEEVALASVCQRVTDKAVRGYFQCRVTSSDGPYNDEFDVVFVRGANVVVVEAKVQRGNDLGASLQKRAQKARAAFGLCRVVFLLPAASADSLRAIEPSMPHCDLIQSDLEAYVTAVTRGLGL